MKNRRNSSWDNANGETGIAPIDSAVRKTLAFEQSHLGNPIVQVALLGFAAYGIYTLISPYLKKKSA